MAAEEGYDKVVCSEKKDEEREGEAQCEAEEHAADERALRNRPRPSAAAITE